MPTYLIEGKQVQSDAPLSDAEIDEIAASIKAPAKERSVGEEFARQIGLTGRAAYEGFTAPATAALDFLSGAYNVGANLLGSPSRIPTASQAQSQMLTRAGLPAPEGTLERAVQAGTQAMTGTAAAARALPNVPVMAANLERQIPAAAAAGVTAVPTYEKVKEVTGSDLAATIAGLGVGAFVGGKTADLAGQVAAGKKPIVSMDEVKQNAQRAYTKVSDLGIEIKPESSASMIQNIRSKLDAANYIPENATQVENVLKKFDEITAGKNLPFDKLEQMRSMANDLKANQDPNIKRLGNVMVNSIDNHIATLGAKDVAAGAAGIDEAVKTVMSARKDWRNLSRATTLEDVLNIAEAKALDPKASEGELIRRGFINLVADKNKMKLFTEAEQNAIRSVAKGGTTDTILSFLARFNPERSQLVAGGLTAGAVAKPEIAVPLATSGFLADKLQGVLRQRAAQQAASGLLTGTTPPVAPNYNWRGLFTGATNLPLAE